MKNMKNKFQEYIAKLVSVGNYYNDETEIKVNENCTIVLCYRQSNATCHLPNENGKFLHLTIKKQF